MRAVRRFVDDPAAQYGFRVVPATYEDAEKITGFRLDRRVNYSINHEGEVEQESWCTLDCSGCGCVCEVGCSCGPPTGCSECGYTGKRRHYFGFPPFPPERKTPYPNLPTCLPVSGGQGAHPEESASPSVGW